MPRYILKSREKQKREKSMADRRLSFRADLHSKAFTRTTTKTTKSAAKRKLLVYRENGKFYIDHSAAYALGKTSVRAIMLEKPKLVEVDLQFLQEMQNRDDIEIEYRDKEKNKSKDVKKGDLSDALDEIKGETYGIGVCNIERGSSQERLDTALAIIGEGLKINNNSKTVLSTVSSLGENTSDKNLEDQIQGYHLGIEGDLSNIVIAVPIVIQNQNGERIFLGFPEESKLTSGQQYESQCILDRICANMKKIPQEFILGYCAKETNGKPIFYKNEGHYQNLGDEDRERLFEELSRNMDEVSRDINSIIEQGDVSRLTQMREAFSKKSMPTKIIDNSIGLVSRFRKPNKRQILLDSYRDVKTSDLAVAKESLREGTLENQRDGEKEI